MTPADSHGPVQLHPAVVQKCFLRGEPTLVDQRLHHGVVAGQPLETALAHQVRTRVAHVRLYRASGRGVEAGHHVAVKVEPWRADSAGAAAPAKDVGPRSSGRLSGFENVGVGARVWARRSRAQTALGIVAYMRRMLTTAAARWNSAVTAVSPRRVNLRSPTGSLMCAKRVSTVADLRL